MFSQCSSSGCSHSLYYMRCCWKLSFLLVSFWGIDRVHYVKSEGERKYISQKRSLFNRKAWHSYPPTHTHTPLTPPPPTPTPPPLKTHCLGSGEISQRARPRPAVQTGAVTTTDSLLNVHLLSVSETSQDRSLAVLAGWLTPRWLFAGTPLRQRPSAHGGGGTPPAPSVSHPQALRWHRGSPWRVT